MATQQIKDILNAEVPKPSFVLSPSVPAPLPTEADFTRSGNVARTLDPYTKDYITKDAGEPRIWGGDQGLLLEGNRTNLVGDSSFFDPTSTGWSPQKHITFKGNSQSVIGEGLIAGKVSGADSPPSNGFLYNVGQTTSSVETLSGIFYRGTANTFTFGLRTPTGGDIAHLQYDWTNDTLTDALYESGSTVERYFRRFNNAGPSGQDVVLVVLKYDHASGTDRQLHFNPDAAGSGKHTFINHVQLEEQPHHSSPIRGNGSGPTTRTAESLSINKTPWWNDKGMTCIVEFMPFMTDLASSFEFVIAWFGNIRLRGSAPFHARYSSTDENGNLFVNTIDSGSVNAFEKNKAAISVTRGKYRAACNGVSDSNLHDGKSLLESNDIIFNSKDGNSMLYFDVKFYNEAFPQTPSDRDAGDPLSIETLTGI